MASEVEASNNFATSASPNDLRSVRSYLEVDDHVVDLERIASNPLYIGDVGLSFTSAQKFSILKRLNLGGLLSLEDLPITATFMIDKINGLNITAAVEILKSAIEYHEADYNIPHRDYDLLVRLVAETPIGYEQTNHNSGKQNLEKAFDKEGAKKDPSDNSAASFAESDLESNEHAYLEITDWEFQTRLEAGLIAYFSPYPEVRSVTDPYDDPTVPCETIRVYILGLIWNGIGTFINQFFSERMPGISLGGSTVQLLLYPCGVLLEKILPKYKFKIWKYEFDLNPGPWTYKEQMLTTIFFIVSGPSYVSWNIHVQKLALFYDNKWVTYGYEILLILSTQFMGFGLAGILRRFTVYPIRAMWPTLLPTLALNRALLTPERKENINGWTISRYNFFFITTACAFVYFWLPNYLFAALSTFNWMTWIAPDNFNLATVTGTISGLGLNPIPSFDWNVLTFNTPFAVPFFAQVNYYAGSVVAFFIIIGIYYSNYYWTAFMPINTNALFSNTGEPYQVLEILNENSLLDEAKYKEYGPPFYSAASLVIYGAFFALYPFAFIYECSTNRKHQWKSLKSFFGSVKSFNASNFKDFSDPHSVMMSRYNEVPDWLFIVVLVISIVLAIVCVEVYPTNTPVWGIFFAVAINFIFLVPMTSIYAATGVSFELNVLVELIVGYALPGNPEALIFIKALGTNIDSQAQNYITDQKMAHYAKIPPWALFRVQMLSVLVSSFIDLAVINFQIDSIKGYCTPGQKDKFTCPGSTTYFSASVIWGVIGPKKVFDGLYPILKYCFLIGVVAGILLAALKIYPKSSKYYGSFHPIVFLAGMLIYAPYNLSYYTGGIYLGTASMWYLKNKYTGFWEKYNYVFSGALGAGTAFSGIIIFFAVQYHAKPVNWWGNNVSYGGLDAASISLKNATLEALDGYFGPRVGHFP